MYLFKQIKQLSVAVAALAIAASALATQAQAQVFNGWSNGNQYRGGVSNGPQGFSGSGHYRGRDAAAGGAMAYRNPNNFQGGGYYQGRNGSNYQGGFSNGQQGVSGHGAWNNGRGTSGSGAMGYRDPRNFQIQGNYNTPAGKGYGANLSRQDGAVNAGGRFSTAGPVPGTRMNYNGDIAFRGADTRVNGGVGVTDPTGRLRLGGGAGALDRRGYTQTQDARMGGARMTQTDDVRFRGANSTFAHSQHANIPGVAQAQSNLAFNRQGVSAGTNVRAGGFGVKVDAGVSSHGIQVRPHVSVPSVNVPRVNVPQIQTPKVSVPKIKFGF